MMDINRLDQAAMALDLNLPERYPDPEEYACMLIEQMARRIALLEETMKKTLSIGAGDG